ncbi:CHASE2 domain-containing protein [Marinospirillum sp.]|uniref:CHASE2 domain-containing protein n=1 Tax=Marinospirillum sp. TaxID=2183934 RepID=UPI0038512988
MFFKLNLAPTVSHRLAVLSSLLLGSLLLLAQFGHLPGIDRLYERWELMVYDLRMQLHLAPEPEQVSTPIVIVDIDEESLRREGRWPWSRHKIAELVTDLGDAGAVLVGFDILFAEPERNPVMEVYNRLATEQQKVDSAFLSQLQNLAPDYDTDRYLGEVLSRREVVLGYTFSHQDKTASGHFPQPLELDQPEVVEQLALPAMAGYTGPLPVLGQNALGSGFFSLAPDTDGVVRRAPLIARYNNQLFASLSLEMVRQYLFLETVNLQTETIAGAKHIDYLALDSSLHLPTDGHGQLLIPFRGDAGSFPYIPAWKLLAGEADHEQLAGALVLVGTTAPGLFDLRATPVDSVYPGVEVHANLMAAMLDQEFLTEPSWAPGANLLLSGLAGLLLAFLLPWLAPIWQTLLATVLAVAITGLTTWLWLSHGIVLALASPLFMVVVLATFNFIWGFYFESLTRHRLANMFGQYVPPQLVEEMSQHPGDFGFHGESRELTVLFSDIRGFTTLSESLEADELKRLLNRYFTPITGVIFENRGTIDKYIGDLVMAFWGAPVKDPDHAVHALKAAHKMLQATEKLSAEFVAEGLPKISIGIGINSGLMNVGDMGSEYRRSYTVLGDAVNLGSRLEGASKYYRTTLVVGERTHELAESAFLWRELDLVRVKGKTEPVRVFHPICSLEEATQEQLDEVARLQEALAAFRSARFKDARLTFEALLADYPDVGVYQLYLERLDELGGIPPQENWDGSWTLTEK